MISIRKKQSFSSFCSRRRISCFSFQIKKSKEEILRLTASGWHGKVSLREFWNTLTLSNNNKTGDPSDLRPQDDGQK